jgi:N-acylneuraminate cytidylyltransferase
MNATPRAVAIIPARGGSKRVPSKTLMPPAGRPLVVHTIEHALAAEAVEAVYVSTEDPEIAAVARAAGAEAIERPAELAADEATSESALLHALDQLDSDPELVVFLQCTSPVRGPRDIDGAVAKLVSEGADSLLSVCEDTSFIWTLDGGEPRSVTYDFRSRQREQDIPPQFRENGSIYVFKPELLRREGNRLGGRIALYEMDWWSSFQLDSPENAELIEWILSRRGRARGVAWPRPLELVVFDFDGVLTDNTVTVTESGGEGVRCHRGDGWGIARLRDTGMEMLVLSTEENPVVSARCEKLGLPCHQGVADKAQHLRDFLAERGISPERVAYVGNDLNDLECLELVGLPVVVADAHPDVLPAAQLVLSRPGGQGAVREFCDRLLARLAEESAARA